MLCVVNLDVPGVSDGNVLRMPLRSFALHFDFPVDAAQERRHAD